MSNTALLKTSKLFQLTSLTVALTLVGCGGGNELGSKDTVDSIKPRPNLGVISNGTSANSGEDAIKDAVVFISLDKDELTTGSDKMTATILVTDKNGGILSGVPVEISIDNAAKYGLSLSKSSNQTTGADGKVEVDIVQSRANINAQIDHQSQLKVVINDSKGEKIVEQSAPIFVTGTQVENISASTGVLGSADNFSIEGMLVDGSGAAVENTSVVLTNNDKAIATGKINNKGKFVFDINSSLLTAINDNYTFGIEVKGEQGVNQQIADVLEIPSISSVNIGFPKIPDILVTARRKVVINVPNARNGDVVTISTNKGKIYKGTEQEVGFNGSQSQDFTVKNKQVTFYIRSEAVGSAIITAEYDGNQKATSINFVSINPAKMNLQVNRAVLGTGDSTPVAVSVYDKDDNPVKNAIVSFSVIKDSSGGQLSRGIAYTDENGMATVNYIAGNNPTGADGVQIEAIVQSVRLPEGGTRAVNMLKDSKYLTVQTSSSYVGFAFADKVGKSSDNIYYIRRGSIFVLNNVGQPAANQKVTLSVIPDTYFTGLYRLVTKTITVQAPSTPNTGSGSSDNSNSGGAQNSTPIQKQIQAWTFCSQEHDSEDTNRNGFLEPIEDVNNNGKLDPINVATILRNAEDTSSSAGQNKEVTFTTDSTGKVDFAIRYPKEYAQWFTATITVNTRVDGSESQSSRAINFPVLVDDINFDKGIFPNPNSPFGYSYFGEDDPRCSVVHLNK